jgi:translocation and assembly module TamA
MKKNLVFIISILSCVSYSISHAASAAQPHPADKPPRIIQLDLQINGPGKNDPLLQASLRKFPLKIGQPLTIEAYNQAKQLLFDAADQTGYINAQLTTHTILIDRQRHTAIIKLQLDTGPRFYFGAVTFSPSPLSDIFLRRYLSFKEGQTYSTNQLFVTHNALSNSPYFQQVSVEPKRLQTKNQHVPIAVTVTPRPARQYTAGIGYGTDTGPRLTLGHEWRYVTKTGHRFSTQLRLSPVQNILQAVYSIPGKNPATDQYTINGSLFQNHLEQGNSLTKQIGVSSITSKGNWQRTLSLNYQTEIFRFHDQTGQSSNLLIPGINWLYLKADNPVHTTEGQRFNIHLQGAAQTLLSTTSFAQAEIQDKYIHSFNSASRIILRGDVGYTAVRDLTVFPLSLRFYAGGTQSVRGYNFQALGPGRYLAVGSAEYQHRIVGNWSGAVFYDVGNAVDNLPLALRRSTGVGLVWFSPVGPMELTVARSFGRPNHSIQLQFNMGPDLG